MNKPDLLCRLTTVTRLEFSNPCNEVIRDDSGVPEFPINLQSLHIEKLFICDKWLPTFPGRLSKLTSLVIKDCPHDSLRDVAVDLHIQSISSLRWACLVCSK